MTGAELLAQVRLYLEEACLTSYAQLADSLDGCVLLTAEEAEKVREWLPFEGECKTGDEALALLSPAGKDERK